MGTTRSSPYQVLPPLTPQEYATLRASIERDGIQYPVIKDENGVTIDGHHREAIANDLGIECPVEAVSGLTEQEKVERALVLNLGRRHLTKEQKADLVNDLRAQGYSYPAIERLTSIPKGTAHRLANPKPSVPDGKPTGWDPEFTDWLRRWRAASDALKSPDNGFRWDPDARKFVATLPDDIDGLVRVIRGDKEACEAMDVVAARFTLLLAEGKVPDDFMFVRGSMADWQASRAANVVGLGESYDEWAGAV